MKNLTAVHAMLMELCIKHKKLITAIVNSKCYTFSLRSMYLEMMDCHK